MKPISPSEVAYEKEQSIPDEVIDEFNKMITANWSAGRSYVYLDDIATAVANRMEIPRNKVFENQYLDVEKLYEKQGWNVKYNSPGYCENYRAFFLFSKK